MLRAAERKADGFIYGSAFNDQYLLRDAASLPRFGHLARKALAHYAGDRYDPHQYGLTVEPFIRSIIREVIAYKLLYRTKAYDWDWIDNTLLKAIGGCLKLPLAFDQSRIDAGFNRDARAPVLFDPTQRH